VRLRVFRVIWALLMGGPYRFGRGSAIRLAQYRYAKSAIDGAIRFRYIPPIAGRQAIGPPGSFAGLTPASRSGPPGQPTLSSPRIVLGFWIGG
jgi:hypothetical protein